MNPITMAHRNRDQFRNGAFLQPDYNCFNDINDNFQNQLSQPQPSIFGAHDNFQYQPCQPQPGIFGVNNNFQNQPCQPQPGIFANNNFQNQPCHPQPGIFANNNTQNQPCHPQSGIFANNNTQNQPCHPQPGIFANNNTQNQPCHPQPGIFANNNTQNQPCHPQPGIFANNNTQNPPCHLQPGIFANNNTQNQPCQPQPGMFGANNSFQNEPCQPQPGIFGANNSFQNEPCQPQPGIFGANNSFQNEPCQPQPGIFRANNNFQNQQCQPHPGIFGANNSYQNQACEPQSAYFEANNNLHDQPRQYGTDISSQQRQCQPYCGTSWSSKCIPNEHRQQNKCSSQLDHMRNNRNINGSFAHRNNSAHKVLGSDSAHFKYSSSNMKHEANSRQELHSSSLVEHRNVRKLELYQGSGEVNNKHNVKVVNKLQKLENSGIVEQKKVKKLELCQGSGEVNNKHHVKFVNNLQKQENSGIVERKKVKELELCQGSGEVNNKYHSKVVNKLQKEENSGLVEHKNVRKQELCQGSGDVNNKHHVKVVKKLKKQENSGIVEHKKVRKLELCQGSGEVNNKHHVKVVNKLKKQENSGIVEHSNVRKLELCQGSCEVNIKHHAKVVNKPKKPENSGLVEHKKVRKLELCQGSDEVDRKHHDAYETSLTVFYKKQRQELSNAKEKTVTVAQQKKSKNKHKVQNTDNLVKHEKEKSTNKDAKKAENINPKQQIYHAKKEETLISKEESLISKQEHHAYRIETVNELNEKGCTKTRIPKIKMLQVSHLRKKNRIPFSCKPNNGNPLSSPKKVFSFAISQEKGSNTRHNIQENNSSIRNTEISSLQLSNTGTKNNVGSNDPDNSKISKIVKSFEKPPSAFDDSWKIPRTKTAQRLLQLRQNLPDSEKIRLKYVGRNICRFLRIKKRNNRILIKRNAQSLQTDPECVKTRERRSSKEKHPKAFTGLKSLPKGGRSKNVKKSMMSSKKFTIDMHSKRKQRVNTQEKGRHRTRLYEEDSPNIRKQVKQTRLKGKKSNQTKSKYAKCTSNISNTQSTCVKQITTSSINLTQSPVREREPLSEPIKNSNQLEKTKSVTKDEEMDDPIPKLKESLSHQEDRTKLKNEAHCLKEIPSPIENVKNIDIHEETEILGKVAVALKNCFDDNELTYQSLDVPPSGDRSNMTSGDLTSLIRTYDISDSELISRPDHENALLEKDFETLLDVNSNTLGISMKETSTDSNYSDAKLSGVTLFEELEENTDQLKFDIEHCIDLLDKQDIMSPSDSDNTFQVKIPPESEPVKSDEPPLLENEMNLESSNLMYNSRPPTLDKQVTRTDDSQKISDFVEVAKTKEMTGVNKSGAGDNNQSVEVDENNNMADPITTVLKKKEKKRVVGGTKRKSNKQKGSPKRKRKRQCSSEEHQSDERNKQIIDVTKDHSMPSNVNICTFGSTTLVLMKNEVHLEDSCITQNNLTIKNDSTMQDLPEDYESSGDSSLCEFKDFKCPNCAYSTSYVRFFKRHIAHHKNVHLLKCDLCSYSTNKSVSLKRHSRWHKHVKGQNVLKFTPQNTIKDKYSSTDETKLTPRDTMEIKKSTLDQGNYDTSDILEIKKCTIDGAKFPQRDSIGIKKTKDEEKVNPHHSSETKKPTIEEVIILEPDDLPDDINVSDISTDSSLPDLSSVIHSKPIEKSIKNEAKVTSHDTIEIKKSTKDEVELTPHETMDIKKCTKNEAKVTSHDTIEIRKSTKDEVELTPHDTMDIKKCTKDEAKLTTHDTIEIKKSTKDEVALTPHDTMEIKKSIKNEAKLTSHGTKEIKKYTKDEVKLTPHDTMEIKKSTKNEAKFTACDSLEIKKCTIDEAKLTPYDTLKTKKSIMDEVKLTTYDTIETKKPTIYEEITLETDVLLDDINVSDTSTDSSLPDLSSIIHSKPIEKDSDANERVERKLRSKTQKLHVSRAYERKRCRTHFSSEASDELPNIIVKRRATRVPRGLLNMLDNN
ncbi:unnamed protein product [Owenia fusiformis]|uniref:C2H2-type domain-containing protein n=1 Tax=Owenia fusiformis TaxID=6347 RepID=A0A8S4NED5_OWEFU|nr:unnamed protein product [Owenia fusiformis]